jgi:hypothetical protein
MWLPIIYWVGQDPNIKYIYSMGEQMNGIASCWLESNDNSSKNEKNIPKHIVILHDTFNRL